jgi:hypothetical protein
MEPGPAMLAGCTVPADYAWLLILSTRVEPRDAAPNDYGTRKDDLSRRRWPETALMVREAAGEKLLARSEGFEPPTLGSEDRCSIR